MAIPIDLSHDLFDDEFLDLDSKAHLISLAATNLIIKFKLYANSENDDEQRTLIEKNELKNVEYIKLASY